MRQDECDWFSIREMRDTLKGSGIVGLWRMCRDELCAAIDNLLAQDDKSN